MSIHSEDTDPLRSPSTQAYVAVNRLPSSYAPLSTFTLATEKQYQQQYADMYFLRLTKLKPIVEAIAKEAWDGFQIAGETVQRVERVLDVRQGSLCWVVGTTYMEMPLKPNILDDISKDHWILAPPLRQKYISPSGDDMVMLEDESGRLRLVGATLKNEMLVTGCIIAVMGTENVNGDFEVVDIRLPELPPQAPRGQCSEQLKERSKEVQSVDLKAGGRGKRLAIVSGLDFSGSNTEGSIALNLLAEFLLGEALEVSSQYSVSGICRLIIAGNSIGLDNAAVSHDYIDNTRKSAKKYGYDSSAYNPAPTAYLDDFLATLLPSLPITILPGPTDPANVSFPQQRIHSAMFPKARAYDFMPPETGEESLCGWLDAATNPWDGMIEGWRMLATSGQNIDDVFKYVESEDRLAMMEAMCRWRCCAPTAPDTLWSYPFQDDDPFVMNSCPHLFLAGSQPCFDTAVIQGTQGQAVRLIAVPRFSATGEIVLVDLENLKTSTVRINAT